MKSAVKNYAINVTAKTVTMIDYTRIIPERLLLIVNVTRQSVLYQFNVTSGVTFAGNVITFPSLSGNANDDHLYVVYDALLGDPVTDAQPVIGADRDLHGQLAVATKDAELRSLNENQLVALESLRFAQQMSTGTGYGGYGYGSYGYGS